VHSRTGERGDSVIEQPGLVSAVVIFLNEERFLEEAIGSVLAQTYPSWELLLVDDGSTDGSTRIARGYARRHPERIRYLEHPDHQNRGMSASRNLGIASSRGEFVALLDADDVWLPQRLERSIALLREHPAAQMVYGRAQYWHSWLGPQAHARDWVQSHWFRANRVVHPPELLVRYLTHEAALPCPVSITVRRDALVDVGGFEDSFRSLYEDQAFLARFCLRHSVYVAEECLDRYRQHADSACAVEDRPGSDTPARQAYLAWLDSHLRAQGCRDSALWKALEFARTANERPVSIWRSRLQRLVHRAADAVRG
jgi:glycosyltransferase involved in cell wall biosynthesis